MVDAVHTLFGTFNKEQLKALKGNLDEIELMESSIKAKKESIGDIITMIHDELKIPKKIITRLVKVHIKKSMATETAEFKEIEALYEGVNSTK